jgi:hypothetical protein
MDWRCSYDTPRHIDSLPAGRELDARVLVHVCGWRWRLYKQVGRCSLVPPDFDYTETATHAVFEGWPSDEERFRDWTFLRYEEMPHPSTSIAAAWDIIEAMHAKGATTNIDHERGRNEYIVRFMWSNLRDAFSIADNAPLAICRAAVRAVFANKEQPDA